MSRGSLVAVVVLFVLARPVHGAPPPTEIWSPRAVKWPVSPGQVQATPGWTPAGIGDTDAPVTVTQDQAAVVWLGALEIVRVRVVRGDTETLRFRRVTGSPGARLWIDDPGARVHGGIQLIEPPGPGSIWTITAARPVTLVVETTRGRPPRLAWEQTRAALSRWISDDVTLPAVAGDDDREFQVRLLGARAFVRTLGPVSKSVAHALRVWRWADAEAAISVRRPPDDPYVDRLLSVPDGDTLVDEGVTYGASPGTSGPSGPWRLTVVGPGSIFVEACDERPPAGWGEGVSTLEVHLDGALAAHRTAPTSPPVTTRNAAALPVAKATQRLGRRFRAALEIGPGRHTLAVHLTQLRWVRIEQRSRRPRLRDPDLGDQVLRARAPLARDSSPAARVADALLARVIG
ncbi:MAG: hypothetical protein H0X17_03385, partial [Deltaproteobacteria bacterium]|nr:hypothetical protein [Deltaproteobacteria bacterium]